MISDAQIILKSGYQHERKAENNKITLTAEELQNKWTVVAKTKDGSLISAPKEVRLDNSNQIATSGFTHFRMGAAQ